MKRLNTLKGLSKGCGGRKDQPVTCFQGGMFILFPKQGISSVPSWGYEEFRHTAGEKSPSLTHSGVCSSQTQFQPRDFQHSSDTKPSSAQAEPTSPHGLVLQHHPVEYEADILGRGRSPGPLFPQQVQDLCGQDSMFTVLNELAEVSQTRLLTLRVLLNDADYTVHNGSLVLEATLGKENQGR